MNPARRPLLVAGLLVGPIVLADAANACPWARRSCCPPPVYYLPTPPPVAVEPAPPAQPAPQPKPPEPAPEVDAAAIYKQVVDSVAFVVTPIKGGFTIGSGSLIDAHKRFVLTNYNLVGDADTVYVQFPVYRKDGTRVTEKKEYIGRIPAGQAFKGKVLHRDKTRDLALVQLDSLPPTAKPIPLAKKSPDIGSRVWNLGSPDAASLFGITEGVVRVVSIEHTEDTGGDQGHPIKCRMVTATNPIGPDDSGAPLVNRSGELVAVAESGNTLVRVVSLSIDVTEVRAFLKEKRITVTGDDPSVAPPAGPAEPADPKQAAQALLRAKIFAEGDDNRPTYFHKLKAVIADYPDTPAAQEAKKLLEAAMK